LLGLAGGVPTRFSLTRGNPVVTVGQWLIAAFAQDDKSIMTHSHRIGSLNLKYGSKGYKIVIALIERGVGLSIANSLFS
jgi:hypothetical protein